MTTIQYHAAALRIDGAEIGRLLAQIVEVIDRSQRTSASKLEHIRECLIETVCEEGYAADLRQYAIIEVAAKLASPCVVIGRSEDQELGIKLDEAVDEYCFVDPAEAAADVGDYRNEMERDQ